MLAALCLVIFLSAHTFRLTGDFSATFFIIYTSKVLTVEVCREEVIGEDNGCVHNHCDTMVCVLVVRMWSWQLWTELCKVMRLLRWGPMRPIDRTVSLPPRKDRPEMWRRWGNMIHQSNYTWTIHILSLTKNLFPFFLDLPLSVSDCGGDRFGPDCSLPCQCSHGAHCDGVNGRCQCPLTWLGPTCSKGKAKLLLTQFSLQNIAHELKHNRRMHTDTHAHEVKGCKAEPALVKYCVVKCERLSPITPCVTLSASIAAPVYWQLF